MESRDSAEDLRILIFTALRGDAALAQRLLREAGFASQRCQSFEHLGAELRRGAGAALITEEALVARRGGGFSGLAALLTAQPVWSALPIILVGRGKPYTATERQALKDLEQLRNVTFLPRPLHVRSLITSVRVAIQSREHQYAIRDLVAELREGVRERDHFLALLAHELRNPLAALANASQIVEMRKNTLDPEVRWASQTMDRQIGQLKRLVDDLLDVARVTQGKIQLQREVQDLGEALARASESVAATLLERKQRLHVEQHEALEIYVDAVRFTQILGNLLHNASRYSEPGDDIWLTSQVRDGALHISVRDRGIGLSAEHQESIFDIFKQVDSTLARTSGGLGLGLTLVRSLTLMHGGEVSVDSAGPGQGSTFTIRLPLSAIAPPAEPAPPLRASSPQRRRVLVVDDNVDAADSLSLLLKALGHDAHTAYSGYQALELYERVAPEIVFLDISMPDLNGYEVAERMRDRDPPEDLRVIALSGLEPVPDETLRKLFDHHLIKPPTLAVVEDLLRRGD